jgi:hypothetical protein
MKMSSIMNIGCPATPNYETMTLFQVRKMCQLRQINPNRKSKEQLIPLLRRCDELYSSGIRPIIHYDTSNPNDVVFIIDTPESSEDIPLSQGIFKKMDSDSDSDSDSE